MSQPLSVDLLSEVARMAIRHGASDAEVIGLVASEFSVEIRLGEIDKVHEANSQGVGLRVLYHGRQASGSSSDTSREAIEELVATTVAMARHTSVDDDAPLPGAAELNRKPLDPSTLGLVDPSIDRLTTQEKADLARAAEEAALATDERIVNSEGASCSTVVGQTIFVNSAGFAGAYDGTTISLATAPIARDASGMQVGYWGDRRRHLSRLDPPAEIGREAARRALRKLGARKVDTQSVPVVFESNATEELLASLFEAVSGSAIFRRASFLVGRLGEEVAARDVTIIDDGMRPGAIGSRPFDSEGLPTRQTAVIEQGRLNSYLLNTYTARKLKLASTGNAVRGLTGAPGVGTGNFFLQPGTSSPAEIIGSVRNGFYVTEMIGFGFNPVTGDYSRGASGWWISEGQLAFPVEEVTIAGNLGQLLREIEMIGNDLHFRGRIAAPTIRVARMMVSGN